MGPSSLCGRNILKVWKPAEHIYQFLQQLPCCSENHWKGKWLSYHPGIYETWTWKEVLCAIQRTKTNGAWLPDPRLQGTVHAEDGDPTFNFVSRGASTVLHTEGPETSCWTELILMQIASLPLAADTVGHLQGHVELLGTVEPVSSNPTLPPQTCVTLTKVAVL